MPHADSEIRNPKSGGFTLVKLLAIITLIGIPIALTMPRVSRIAMGVGATQNAADAEDEPVAYRAFLDKVDCISDVAAAAASPALPASLVIAPGRYTVYGRKYDLQEQGLYRFCRPVKENQQRIVYDPKAGNVEVLLSSLAWIASHGNADASLSNDALTEKATTAKLFINCGRVSAWALPILSRYGIRARMARGTTLDQWNSYDNGHILVEVYRDDAKKWVLYDLDMNVRFWHKGSPLSLVEMSERSASGDYETTPLAADTMLDVSHFKKNGYEYAFLAERILTKDGLRRWYKRVLQVPIVDNWFYLPVPNDADRRRLEKAGFKYMEKDEFLKRFYGQPKRRMVLCMWPPNTVPSMPSSSNMLAPHLGRTGASSRQWRRPPPWPGIADRNSFLHLEYRRSDLNRHPIARTGF
jgi:hypothetical protein